MKNKKNKKNTFMFDLRHMIMEAAKGVYPNPAGLSNAERKEETEKQLKKIQVLKTDGKRLGQLDMESINYRKTLVAALNYGLIDLAMDQTGCGDYEVTTEVYELEDFEEAAVSVLMDCADHYDPSKGAFSTYVIESVKRKINELKNRNGSVFGTEQSGKDMRDIRKAASDLEAAGEGASPEAICERIHRNNPKSTLTKKKIKDVSRYMTRTRPEDCVGGKDGDANRNGKILERQPDRTPESWEAADANELKRAVHDELFRYFPSTEAEIIYDRLGMKLSETIIAEKYGVKKEDVRRLCAQALRVLEKSTVLRRFYSA